MKKVYIVTDGDYSDYHIVGVFSDKKEAQNVIDGLGGEPRLESWDLDKTSVPKGYRQYFVRMAQNGDVRDSYEDNSTHSLEESDFDVNGNMYSYAFAKDEKHAIKIVNERRAQKIATNTWNKK